MNKNIGIIVGFIILAVIIVGVYVFQNSKEDAMMVEKQVEQKVMEEKGVVEEKAMMTMVYQYAGELSDVTKGKVIRGTSTDGKSSGVAKANFKDGVYNLYATFSNLPDLKDSNFYEGWIVRKSLRYSVISTGKLEKVGNMYTNLYTSEVDLTDHSFYVLTLEPNDGNPKPADHILEGTMVKNK